MNKEMFDTRLYDMHMSFSSFARQMGMSRTTLYRKVNGQCEFHTDEVKKAIEIFGITDPEEAMRVSHAIFFE